MSAHPNALGLLDRAKRLIDESNPPDESPLTTASRDIREARAAIAELIEVCSLTVDFAWEPGRYALYDKSDNVYGIDRYASEYEAENAREELIRAALARVGGGK